MRPIKCKEQISQPDLPVDEWQTRTAVERRAEHDNRRKKSRTYFNSGGQERRTGKERRCSEERRDGWMRVDRWRSVPVFDD